MDRKGDDVCFARRPIVRKRDLEGARTGGAVETNRARQRERRSSRGEQHERQQTTSRILMINNNMHDVPL